MSLPVLQFPPPPGALAHLPVSETPVPTPQGIFTPTSDDGDDAESSDSGSPPSPPNANRWFFEAASLESTPSRKCGMEWDKELTLRQQSANFIQDIGQRLQVNQLCINTAIVYMHRFYMYHSFTLFPKNAISTASIFLAAKVEEQPRKLEYVIKIAHYCLYRETQPPIDIKSETYFVQSSELVSNENILLQTLGFDVSVDHPHTHVVKCCQLVRASKDLAQTSYFMATNSLHLTTMCLKYLPSVVACVCIHLSCKWSNWEIPRSKEGKEWYYYVDETVTPEKLDALTNEFLTVFNKSPARLKKKILSLSAATSGGAGGSGGALTNFPTHFTLDKNAAGVQTIKSRSRSPSPTTSHSGIPKPRPPTQGAPKPAPPQGISPNRPVKPLVAPPPPQIGGQPHHFGNKPAPGPYPGMDKRPHVGLPPKPLFPNQQPPSQVQNLHSTAHHTANTKEPPHHGMKPTQPYPQQQHPMSNGVHGPYHANRPPHQHPVPHHSAAPSMGSHGHPAGPPGPHSHPAPKPNPGSQPNHHYPPKPAQHAPLPIGHPVYNKQLQMQSKPLFPPHANTGTQVPPNSNMVHKDGYVRPMGQTYPPHHTSSSNGAHGQFPYQHGNRSMHPHAPAHPAHPSASAGLTNQTQAPSMAGPKPLMATHVPPPDSLKRRQPEPTMLAGSRPQMPNTSMLKRARQEGVNQSNLSSITPSAEEVLKHELAKKPFYPSIKTEVKLEPAEQSQAGPPSLMPTLTYNTFPHLKSEFEGAVSATANNYRSDGPPVLMPQIKSSHHAFPQLTNSINASQPANPANNSTSSASDANSSSKKKKKKKEHKHKKDKEEKEHRHKEKHHKKDKHRSKETEKHKSSKDKHHHRSSTHESEPVKETKIRVVPMPPRDPKEKNKHTPAKNIPSLQTWLNSIDSREAKIAAEKAEANKAQEARMGDAKAESVNSREAIMAAARAAYKAREARIAAAKAKRG